MINPIKAVLSRFYSKLRGKSKNEQRELDALYNRYKRQLLIITTTAHNLFKHISYNLSMKGFSKEEVTENLLEFERLTNSFVELSKGERFQIDRLERAENEEIDTLGAMMDSLSHSAPAAVSTLKARANEILTLEEEERQIYHQAATAVDAKAHSAARLHELLSNPEKNAAEIGQKWDDFQRATNELALQLQKLLAIEKRIASAQDNLEKAS